MAGCYDIRDVDVSSVLVVHFLYCKSYIYITYIHIQTYVFLL